MKSSSQTENHAGYVSVLTAGILTAAIGLFALLGWITRLSFLATLGSGYIPMAPSTALFFVLLGGSYIFSTLQAGNRAVHSLSTIAGVFVLIAGLALTISASNGAYSEVEHLGLTIGGTAEGVPLGHMAPVTAACFVFIASSFLLKLSSSEPSTKHGIAEVIFSCLVLVTSAFLVLAYLIGSPLMYGRAIIPPSLPTSLAFFVLALGPVVSAAASVRARRRTQNDSAGRVSIQYFLIFVVLAGGILATGHYALRAYADKYRTEIEQQLTTISQLKIDELVHWREERLGDAAVLHQNASFSRLVDLHLGAPGNIVVRKSLQSWLRQLQEAYHFDRVCLHDGGGIERLSSPEGLEQPDSLFLRRAEEIFSTRQILFQDFYRDEHDGRIYLNLLVPVLSPERSGHVTAIVAMRMDPEKYLYPLLNRWPVPTRSAETLLLRREGDSVVFLNELRFERNTALERHEALSNENMPAVKAALGLTGITEGVDYRGVPVVADLRPVPGTPWFLVARMDLSEVYDPVRGQFWLLFLLVGALTTAAGAGVGMVWRHQRSLFYQKQYESAEALRESEALLLSIVDNSGSLIYIADTEGKFLLANQSLASLLAVSRDEMVGHTRENFMPKEIAELHRANDLEVLNSGRANVMEEENPEQDGRHIYLSTKFPLLNSDGNIYAVGGISSDITERKRAEEALRESENRYRSLFENMPEGYAYCEMLFDGTVPVDFVYIVVNNSFETLTGLHGVEGKRVTEVLPGIRKSNPELFEIYGKVALSGMPEKFESYLESLGVWFSVAVYSPKRGYFVAIFENITGRKRSEAEIRKLYEVSERSRLDLLSILEDQRRVDAALRESETKYRELFDNAQVGMYRSKLDGSAMLAVNSKLCEIFGYTREEMLDNPATIRWADPGARDEMVRIIAQHGSLQDYRVDIVTKTGEIRNCSVSIQLNRENEYIEGSATDITDRNRIEEALKESQTLYHSFIEQLPNPVFRKDREGRYVLVNSQFCRLKGVRREDVLGRKPVEVADDQLSLQGTEGQAIKYANVGEEVHEQILRTGTITESEEEYTSANGAVLHMHVVRMPVCDSRGAIIGTQGIMSDISERHRAEEEIKRLNADLEIRVAQRTTQLETANKELEAFSYSVSHDLRAPLRAIDGFSRILLDEYSGTFDAEGKRILGIVCENTKKMDELITDLLDLSRVGRNEMRRSPVDMDALSIAVYQELAPPELQAKISFSVAQVPDAYCDSSLMRQVWRNLISNALKFTATKDVRTIEIGGSVDGDFCTYFIRDTGVGFNPVYMHKLFGVFQRLHNAAEFEGTGVGLAIVQRIIQRHGGKVWAEGKVGAGATFWFSLPAREA